jgi:catechol 2,3-dioxygenase-like lactoylglutathione lyase family enzyme
MEVRALQHVSIPVARGGGDRARDFYGRVLGLTETAVPQEIRAGVAAWYQIGDGQIHLLYGEATPPDSRHHFALAVDDLAAFRRRLAEAGVAIQEVTRFPNWERFTVRDPFGNLIEILQLPG